MMRGWVVVVVCLVAMPAWVDQAWADEAGVITTHATARTRIANTVADVSLGVDAAGRTAAEVQEALGRGSQLLVGYLKGQGVERLSTGSIGLSPQMEAVSGQANGRGQANRIVGYSGRLRVSFRVKAERLGAVVSGALGQGGNALDGISLSPLEGEVDAAGRAMAAEAVRTALAQAGAVAEAAGLALGPVRRIDVEPGGARGRPAPMMAMARAAMPAAPMATEAMATEAGDTEVEATVAVTVAISGGLAGH